MKVSNSLESLKGKKRDLSISIFLKACELSCMGQTDGVYKAPDSKKKALDFYDSLERIFSLFAEDINCTWYKKKMEKTTKGNSLSSKLRVNEKGF